MRLRPSGSRIDIDAGLGLGREADRHARHQLPGIALENLLNGAALERLAVPGAFDPPGRRRFGALGRQRAGRHEGGGDCGQRQGRQDAMARARAAMSLGNIGEGALCVFILCFMR